MKMTRKGFTLVELLIVVAIIGALAATMTMSSTESVDRAGANSIISNLQSMKVAAYQMYMYEPKIASKTSIAIADTEQVDSASTPKDDRTIAAVLGSYLGKKDDALGITDDADKKYGLVASTNATTNVTSWFVVYKFDDASDSKGVKAQLANKAGEADLYSVATAAKDLTDTDTLQAGYVTNATCVALKVR